MTDTFEVIKTIGSIVGLATGIFVLVDRFVRGRPAVSLTSEKLWDLSPSKEVGVRVTNTSTHHDISVIDIVTVPKLYHLLPDHQTDTIVRRLLDRGELFFVLKPGESRAIWLSSNNDSNGKKHEDKNQNFKIKVFWRNGTITWLPQIPRTIRTNTQTVRKYRENELDGFDD